MTSGFDGPEIVQARNIHFDEEMEDGEDDPFAEAEAEGANGSGNDGKHNDDVRKTMMRHVTRSGMEQKTTLGGLMQS